MKPSKKKGGIKDVSKKVLESSLSKEAVKPVKLVQKKSQSKNAKKSQKLTSVIKVVEKKSKSNVKLSISDKTNNKAKTLQSNSVSSHPDETFVSKVLQDESSHLKETHLGSKISIQPTFKSYRSDFSFSLPLSTNPKHLSNFARIAGIFFVFSGGILSLSNLHHISNVPTPAQNAAFTDEAILNNATTTSVPVSDTNLRPEVRIVIDAPQPLHQLVPVRIMVPGATQVKVLVESSMGNVIFLGSAQMIDASTWSYSFDTRQVPNGEYKLRAYISLSTGPFVFTSPITYVLQNSSETNQDDSIVPTTGTTTTTRTESATTNDSGTASSSSSATTTTTTTTPDTENVIDEKMVNVSLDFGSTTVAIGLVPIQVKVAGASEVKIYARNTYTGTLYYVGLASKRSDGLWGIVWDSTRVPNGAYAFVARAFISDKSYESPRISLSVRNTVVDNAVSPALSASTTNTREATSTDATLQQPTISFKLSREGTLTGFVDLYIETSSVESVEAYLVPRSSFNPIFLGSAIKQSESKWKFSWQTTQTPNGEYALFVRAKNKYGNTDSQRKGVTVINPVVDQFSPEQEKTMDTFNEVKDSLVKMHESSSTDVYPENTSPKDQEQHKVLYVQPTNSFIESVDATEAEKEKIEDFISDFRRQLNSKLAELALATRNNDIEKVKSIKDDIEKIRTSIILQIPESTDKKDLVDKVSAYLSKIVLELQDMTVQNETILKERIGDAVKQDTDRDSISDYDEINFYRTNPFSADSDGDSFIDSVEITKGYDPNNSKIEALVAYESPKESPIVRDDLLKVEDITTVPTEVTTESTSTEKSVPKALISGKGLPNSFVTLYIFSTPVIVTIKTDDSGNWSYVFDKEIEDGSHEVYVGITDNEGRVVARSNPLPFVKTAEAFTKENEASSFVSTSEATPSFFSHNLMLLVGSIAVVALGLVLILLGLHVTPKGKVALLTTSQTT